MRGFLWSGTDARMCNLYTCACTRVHLGTGTGAGMYVYNVLLTVFSMAAILPFAFQLLFNLIDQISILDFLGGG